MRSFVLGELEGVGRFPELMSWGRLRSVADELKVCWNQPERRVGMSERRVVE